VTADVVWENLAITGAFLLGAVLATFATIRVVRAVSAMFEREPRHHRRRDDDQDSSGSAG
jgi:hypothetical protein